MTSSVQYRITFKIFSTGILRLRKEKLIFSFPIRNSAIILRGNWQRIFLGNFFIQSNISRVSSTIIFVLGLVNNVIFITLLSLKYTYMNLRLSWTDRMRYMTPVGKPMVDKAKLLGGFSPASSNFTYLYVCTIAPCLHSFAYHRTYIIVETEGVLK
jgi:hypothetical protein